MTLLICIGLQQKLIEMMVKAFSSFLALHCMQSTLNFLYRKGTTPQYSPRVPKHAKTKRRPQKSLAV